MKENNIAGLRRRTKITCPKCGRFLHTHDERDGICPVCEKEKYDGLKGLGAVEEKP